MDTLNHELILKIVQAVVVVVGGMILINIINRGLVTMATNANLPKLALNPLRTVIRYLVAVGVLFLVLTLFGYNVNGLLTMLTGVAAMVAVGFVAVWSVLSNFLCTFVLILFKPFSVGDELEIPADKVQGRVVDLSLLFTTLRTPDGANYLIPNNMFFQRIMLRRRGEKPVELGEQLQRDKAAE